MLGSSQNDSDKLFDCVTFSLHISIWSTSIPFVVLAILIWTWDTFQLSCRDGFASVCYAIRTADWAGAWASTTAGPLVIIELKSFVVRERLNRLKLISEVLGFNDDIGIPAPQLSDKTSPCEIGIALPLRTSTTSASNVTFSMSN